jgi:hypothetical protein
MLLAWASGPLDPDLARPGRGPMMKRAAVPFGLVVLGALGSAHAATTYHVAPGGDDAGDGSSQAPFATIQHAADIVAAGDTVVVRDGTYTDTDADDMVVHLTGAGAADGWVSHGVIPCRDLACAHMTRAIALPFRGRPPSGSGQHSSTVQVSWLVCKHTHARTPVSFPKRVDDLLCGPRG